MVRKPEKELKKAITFHYLKSKAFTGSQKFTTWKAREGNHSPHNKQMPKVQRHTNEPT
jgi:hypothetical protein